MGQSRVRQLPVEGAHILTPDAVCDERGFFARSWSEHELRHAGAPSAWRYSAFAYNTSCGTLRGLHYQAPPQAEAKTVTCVRGAVWDVIVDIRPESPTFKRWHAERLSGSELGSLYVPAGCAHGYLTLTDDALVSYRISHDYHPDLAGGIRWDDPVIGIPWPSPPTVISERDMALPLWREAFGEVDA